jgi:CheY-like chemotaxis protein
MAASARSPQGPPLDLEPIRFSLDDCLSTIVRILTQRIQAEGLTFALEVAEDVPRHLFGDRDRLLQVLLNLVGNAVKFTPAGGSVWLHVRIAARVAEQALLRFDVRDTGIGIAADERKAIFEPFTQARVTEARKAGGSGLGLAIASRLAELMQGTLSLESEPGRGSCFSFTACFGLWQPEPAPEPATSIARAPLVAEDNQINQMAAARLLILDGHMCTVAGNGAEALRLLESQTFDAVLMDVQMPVMDGLVAAREIRRREQETGQHVYIIAVTASATTEVVAECTASGMDHYVSKPLRIDALRDALRVAQDRARGQQRP